jgi:hypothetical protein
VSLAPRSGYHTIFFDLRCKSLARLRLARGYLHLPGQNLENKWLEGKILRTLELQPPLARYESAEHHHSLKHLEASVKVVRHNRKAGAVENVRECPSAGLSYPVLLALRLVRRIPTLRQKSGERVGQPRCWRLRKVGPARGHGVVLGSPPLVESAAGLSQDDADAESGDDQYNICDSFYGASSKRLAWIG